MQNWAQQAVFYHIYPLGMCGAPLHNFSEERVHSRLPLLQDWIPHLKKLGVNALYIGPLWESSSHGYDTINYHHLDRRLGQQDDLLQFVQGCHQNNIRIVVDAVFNHVGRDFFAFRSLKAYEKDSPYLEWFANLKLGKRNARGDRFTYEGWKGHDDLVKLNLNNPEVKHYFFEVVRFWIQTFDIDGLRLDAADCMDKAFLKDLKAFCKKLKPDFFLVGEVVMGDYREWKLDAITNYELYDSLHKSHNRYDYRQLAQTLDRQFGTPGVYRDQLLFNFADNHDVNRIASLLKKKAHLYPLYLLLFTLPGTPCVYYGSEVGLEGKRLKWSDRPLRPFLPHPRSLAEAPHQDLFRHLCEWSALRQSHPALYRGSYQTVLAEKHLFCFYRACEHEDMYIIVNLSAKAKLWPFPAANTSEAPWQDLLNPTDLITPHETNPLTIHPNWGRILCRKKS